MIVFINFIFHFVFLVGLYRIVIVSRVVITDCSSLCNFFLICVITPCYVIIFVMLCHLLHCKLIKGNCNLLFICSATDEGH